MPEELKSVLNDVIKAVNFIKANALNSRLFRDLCKESDFEFETLLLYSHVRWLSKGKVLKRVFVLRKEIHEFLHEATAKQVMSEKFTDNRFLTCLPFFGRHLRIREFSQPGLTRKGNHRSPLS